MVDPRRVLIVFIANAIDAWLPAGAVEVSDPPVMGVLHSDTFPYAIMMKS